MEKKYGEIFTVNIGFGHNCIVVSSVDLVNELLVEKSKEFAGRDTSLWSLYLISGGYKDLLFDDYGPVWTVQKKMAVKVLSYEIDDPEFVWLREKFAENMTVLFGSRLPADLIPFLKHVPIPSTLRAKKISRELHDFHRRKLKEHKATLNSGRGGFHLLLFI
ncbi:uncharacterized protein LOC106157922 [Lingula anatina]|uniref:Uncharacterized protein LOC106157922 n=1 Tax=Lingula anatina TaxID=7574 RepID=A0A1S3HT06_LINAN|nr:uncharacterized protein LOC106157922 [Lingula anatina]XP_013389173.1 uncharacterized protein LOC106157922 [Lingula anatina]|eukprot:XP_013389172.1 uncharacterized protein LOC106157922 [Lingula anatina]